MEKLEHRAAQSSIPPEAETLGLMQDAAKGMDRLMTESRDLWASYYWGISDTDEASYLVETHPDEAVAKRKEAEVIGSAILAQENPQKAVEKMIANERIAAAMPMTRPMGPLEIGDQAIIDAIDRIDTEPHLTEQILDSGRKIEGWGSVSSYATGAWYKSQTEDVRTYIAIGDSDNEIPRKLNVSISDSTGFKSKLIEKNARVEVTGGDINVHLESSRKLRSHRALKITQGNVVLKRGSWEHDRKKAQKIKLEAAKRLDSARKHLTDMCIAGERLSYRRY